MALDLTPHIWPRYPVVEVHHLFNGKELIMRARSDLVESPVGAKSLKYLISSGKAVSDYQPGQIVL